MSLLSYISKKFLKGRFMLAAAAIGLAIGTGVEMYREKAAERNPVDPEQDRINAVFSPKGDPALTKPYYGIYEGEMSWLARHHEMMKDTANVRELQQWLSQLDKYKNASVMQKLEGIRSLVQGSVKYAYDNSLYGKDYLAPPLQTIRAKLGDCDDFASLYYICLRYLGFPENKCYEMIVGSHQEISTHRVAIVDTSGSDEKQLLSRNIFILDNGSAPLKQIEISGFVPEVLINRDGSHVVKAGLDSAVNMISTGIKKDGIRKYLKETIRQ